jgi:hypothetical protein
MRVKNLINKVGTDVSGKWVGIDNVELLAELIVRECALQCRHNDDMDRIEKHFGVEE